MMRPYILVFLFLLVACSSDDTGPTPINLPSNSSTVIINDTFEDEAIVIAGNPGRNFVVSFYSTTEDGTSLSFTSMNSNFPIILEDHEGNHWNIFGICTSGQREGEVLRPTGGYMGYWFAWGAIFPGVEIHDGPELIEVPKSLEPAEDWTISNDFVIRGLGQDGIPSVDNPHVIVYKEKDWLEDDWYVKKEDFVIGVIIEGQVRLYPHGIMNWHEVVNDHFAGQPITISFCPLTGTALAWKREFEGWETTFGISGLLFNNNVIVYDRASESNWSQMKRECVNGHHINEPFENVQVLETTWKTWLEILGQPEVLSTETGFSRNYFANPYGSYPTDNNQVVNPLEFDDPRLLRKERVHGIVINGKAKVYTFSSFKN